MIKFNRIYISGMLCMFSCMVFFGCKAKNEEVFLPATEVDSSSESEIVEEEVIAEVDENLPICVYVCGAVTAPGVYELSASSRVMDAINAAGGFSEDACIDYWNQAEHLNDGQMIYVPNIEEAAEREAFSDRETSLDNRNSSKEKSDGKININTASKELLTTISGIGDGRAESIIRYREENGRFSTIDEIKNVSGIGESIFEKIRDVITIN